MDKVKKFYKEYRIDPSYYDFFTLDIVEEVEEIFKVIGEDYTPSKDKVFKIFKEDLSSKKVVLLGMDPYPQEGVATGYSFEVDIDSWQSKRVNTSLKNIMKLIYKSYTGKIFPVSELRERMEEDNVLPPSEIFKDWSKKGCIFLNGALTTKIGKSGAHIKYWKSFTRRLIEYMHRNNRDLIFLVWGEKAKKIVEGVEGIKIIEHNHPAICGNLKNPRDFLNGRSFIDTKSKIKWLEI